MNMKQLIGELNSECILTKLEKKEITELLQEGDKYKQMWERFDDLYGHFGIIPIGTYYRIEILMERLKQKYFPK